MGISVDALIAQLHQSATEWDELEVEDTATLLREAAGALDSAQRVILQAVEIVEDLRTERDELRAALLRHANPFTRH